LIDKKNGIQKAERAVLVGLVHKTQTEEQSKEYLDELAFLAETAGAVTLKRFTQKLEHPDSKTFVGKGKLEEIKTYIQLKDVQVVVFDDELSGSQISNIEKILDTKTIDRSDLILENLTDAVCGLEAFHVRRAVAVFVTVQTHRRPAGIELGWVSAENTRCHEISPPV